LLSALCACAPPRHQDLHWDRAQDLIIQAELEAGEQGPDHTDEIWQEILVELGKVHPRYARYEDAMKLREEIRAKREAAQAEKRKLEASQAKEEEERRAQLESTLESLGKPDPFTPDTPNVLVNTAGSGYDIQLVRLGSTTSGRTFRVEGEVQGVASRNLVNVMVIVDFLDSRGRVLSTAQAMLEPPTLLPSSRATFQAETQLRSSLARYTLRFRELSGNRLRYPDPGVPMTR
jgi:hypothetical protein